MDYLFRFGHARPFQKEMMDDISSALADRRDILVNAPTGVGKTDASISAVLTFALKNDLDVLFLTPKISQHRIVVDALTDLRAKFTLSMNFVDMVGKRNMCINDRVNMIESDAFYPACESLVKHDKCQYFSKAKLLQGDASELAGSLNSGHNSLFEESFNRGLCAYEVAAKLARNARVIIAGYPHVLNPFTKGTFMKKIAHSMERSIVIWDEAHNILEAANSYFSNAISEYTIERASKELQAVGSPMDLGYLAFALSKLADRRIKAGGEAFVEMDELPTDLTQDVKQITSEMEKAGLEYIEASKAKRSSLLHLSGFLKDWMEESTSVARIINRRGGKARLSLSCLYPERSLPVFGEAYSNIFMSATLVPLEMYADLFGVEGAMLRSYGSPFPKANRMAFIDDSVTTKYEHRSVLEYKKIAVRIASVKERVPGNIAVFFPSFEVLESVYRYMQAGSSILVQRRDMRNIAVEKLIKDFQESEGTMLFAVMGGSLSEGIDYQNNSIKGIVIVGIPLTRPDLELSAKINYINGKFAGKGNEYMYLIPAIIRAVQAAGRAIRSEKDKAVIVFMDMRYGWRMYSSLIGNSMPIEKGRNYPAMIEEFWRARKAPASALEDSVN